MNCQYVREHYNVPAEIGRRISFNGRPGIIEKGGGAHVAVNFDDMKPGQTLRIHPADPGLEYLEMGKVRPITRSQKRYRDYIDSEYEGTFAEFIGVY